MSHHNPHPDHRKAADRLRQETSLQTMALLALPLLEHTPPDHQLSYSAVRDLCKKILEDYGAPHIAALCLPVEKIATAKALLAHRPITLVAPLYLGGQKNSEKFIKDETLSAFAVGADEVALHIPASCWSEHAVLYKAWESCLEQCARYHVPATAVFHAPTKGAYDMLSTILRAALSFGFTGVKISQNPMTPECRERALEALWIHGFDKEKRIIFHQPHLILHDARAFLGDALQLGLPLTARHIRLATQTLFFEAIHILGRKNT